MTVTLSDAAWLQTSLTYRRDNDAPGEIIAVEFIKRNLNGSTYVLAEQTKELPNAQPCST